MFSFSGFGTVGAVHSSEDRAEFTDSIFKPTGAGGKHPWSTDVDSRLGAQVSATLSPKLTAVLQVITDQNYDNTYRPHVEWANLKYEFTPDFNLRLGRTVLPSFLFSDSRNVGYVNPWVRPPVEAYSLVPIDTTDGVDASYSARLGEVANTFVAGLGYAKSNTPTGGGNEARRLLVVADTVEYGPATVHAAYQQGYLTVGALGPLFDAFRQFGPQGVALADRYGVSGNLFRFFDVGALVDPGHWFVMGEWGTVDLRSVLGKSTAWYGSAGYRVAKLTPYLMYSELTSDSNRSDPGLTVATLPVSLAPAASGLNAALNSILGSIPVQRTASVGVRWDLVKNVDLKLQYDRSRLGAGSPGVLINLQPGFQPGGTVNLFTVVIDFVL
jgi:hypothetical protein